MISLIEAFFTFLTALVKSIFSFLGLFFGFYPVDKLYKGSRLSWFKRIWLFSRFHRGLILNGKNYKLSVKKSRNHGAIVGKSGIGKSSIYYAINLLKANGKSIVVTDLDGGLFKTTSGYLKSKGYDIQVFDLGSVQTSGFYNCIFHCKTIDDLRALAVQIITSNSMYSKSDKFWDQSAINLLFNLLKLIWKVEKKYQNLYNVKYLLTMIETDEFDSFVSDNADESLFREFVAFKSIEDKLRTNIEATLSATLDMLSYGDIAFITSDNTIDFERLTKPKSILYVIVPERLIRQYSLVVSVFYAQLFDYVRKNRPKRNTIFFLLDEAGAYRVNDMDVLISTLRKHGCSVSLAVQNYEQLVNLYGPNSASTIYANCSTKIIFPGASLSLAEEISRASGNKSVEIEYNGKKRQETRPKITATEIIEMKDNELLIQYANTPYVKVKSRPFYKSLILKLRSKKKPLKIQPKKITTPPLLSLSNNPLNDIINEEK